MPPFVALLDETQGYALSLVQNARCASGVALADVPSRIALGKSGLLPKAAVAWTLLGPRTLLEIRNNGLPQTLLGPHRRCYASIDRKYLRLRRRCWNQVKRTDFLSGG